MSLTCLFVSPHLKENCGYGKYKFRKEIILIFQIFKIRKRSQTKQLYKCNSRFETRIFSSRFVDFRQYANAFTLFGTPFQTNVEEVEEKYQLELIDLQCNKFVKARYDLVSTVNIYQKYVAPRKKLQNFLAECQNNDFVICKYILLQAIIF